MGQLDASIVTPTYRPLQVQFGASLAAVQWMSLSYLLTLAALLGTVGRLAEAPRAASCCICTSLG